MPPSNYQGPPEAWIIAIGNELLIGRIVDTNSAWLARRLTFLGFRVRRIVKVPDEISDIVEELRRAIERASVVITTGGLGPTYDDKTLEAVAKATGRELELNDEALRMVAEFYSKKNLPLTPEREKMAKLPRGSKPLPNPVGAAPGVLLELGKDKIIVSLPGVPSEMKAIFDSHVAPRLEALAPPRALWECSLIIEGIPESTLAPIIEEIARRNPTAYIKSHPKGHEVMGPVIDLRVLASAPDESEAKIIAESIIERFYNEVIKLGGKISQRTCGKPS
ncbi:MAG: nicotinamide mononucleotide deamidase-related protein [Desulfurococcales archaeon]|nr:nicotinamide mononucleotide deamidase-related protein [Desulfurococcales archaeon]